MQIESVLRAGPVIPVLQFHSVADGVAVSRALSSGGVRVLEITLRTPAALDVIHAVRDLADDIFVGAGTVTRPEQFAAAKAAGARFAVSPGITAELAQAAQESGLAWLPGVATASEVLQAQALGYDCLKLFPAEAVGGVPLLKALYGPFADVRFCPTGGITAESAPAYLALPNVLCVGGSWLTPPSLIARGDWDVITTLARAASGLPRSHTKKGND